jgi:hypothetical protein
VNTPMTLCITPNSSLTTIEITSINSPSDAFLGWTEPRDR